MCIVIYKPSNLKLKMEILENCFHSNPDGAGFIVREDSGELLLKKGFFTFKTFFEEYKEHEDKQAIIHFRIKTHGDINIENCHPFWVVENKVAFAHNGVIRNVNITDLTKSDTWYFNTDVLQHLENKYGLDFLDDPVMQRLISEFIGYSKLVFLKENGDSLIFNKHHGEEADGVWFSNTSYRDTFWREEKKNKKKSKWNKWKGIQTSIYDLAANDYWKNRNTDRINNTDMSTQAPREYPRLLAPVTPILPDIIPRPLTPKIGDFVEVKKAWSDIAAGKIGKVWHIHKNSMYLLKIFDPSFKDGFFMRSIPQDNVDFYFNNEGGQ